MVLVKTCPDHGRFELALSLFYDVQFPHARIERKYAPRPSASMSRARSWSVTLTPLTMVALRAKSASGKRLAVGPVTITVAPGLV